MAFVHSKETGVLVDEYDLTQYFTAVNAQRQIQAVRTTTLGLGGHTYLAGIESGQVSVQGLWDGDASAVDEILDAAIGAETIWTVGLDGVNAYGDHVVMMKAETAGYDIRSTVLDAVRITASGTADDGVRTAGRIIHPLTAETAAGNLTSVDDSASSANGAVAHLHVTAFTGTSATVKIQDSADNSTFADLVTFTAATGATKERKTVAGTVNRYLRVNLAGTFTSVTFAVALARHRR